MNAKHKAGIRHVLNDAAVGRFEFLLTCEVDRLTSEEPILATRQLSSFLKAGVRVHAVDGQEIDFKVIGNVITSLVSKHHAEVAR